MRKCRKCGADFFKQSSSSEQLCPDCRKNKTYENNNPVSKTNHAGKIIACIFSVAVLSIGGFFAYKSLSSNTPTVQQAETAYESYEKVNSTLSDIISDADFQNSSEEDKKQKIENALNLMVEESMISDINYNEGTMIYEYIYSNGSLGGVMLEPFEEGVNGITKSYADIDQSGKVKSVNNKVSFDTEKYSYSRTDMKAKVMYGLGFDDVLKMVDKRSDVWTSEGLATDIDKDCTVADFAEGLIGYDFIDIEEHGTYEMYKGYMGHNHAENDEMWFQDITGDDEPELIIGGYGLMIGQSERKCFNVYEKDNGGIAFGEDLYTLWSSNRSDYGHDAFSFTPYKDSNGKIILADGQFYAYTGADLPEDAGAYTLNEFVFGNSDKKIQCSVKIYFNYDSENKKYISLKVGNDEATSSEVINAYNNYFTDKTPLKASIKTIKKLDYIKMTQEERKKALTESYYAFKYTEDKTIKPPLKDMIDKIPKDNSDKDDTDNVEKNNNPNVKDIYSAYLDKLSELNQQPSVEPAYSLFDINRDGIDELIYIYDRVAVASRFHVYEYHPDDGSVVSTGDSDTTWNDLYYSKTLDCLVNYYSHGCNVDENTPSGIITFLTKYSLVNGKLESEEIYKGDAQEFSENKYSYYDLYEITIGQCSGCTIDDLKSNSASNKF